MRSFTFLLLLLSPLGTTAQRQRVSRDATCGAAKGYTCLGSGELCLPRKNYN